MTAFDSLIASVRPVSADLAAEAQRRLDSLTKPRGSLGRIESLARSIVCVAGRMDYSVRRKVIFTFAADHGITEEGVSLYPRTVTAQMVENFVAGGAAVNVLARKAGAEVCVIDAGTLVPAASSGSCLIQPMSETSALGASETLIRKRIGAGTRNFLVENAMSRADAVRAVEWGADVFEESHAKAPIDLAGVGDMGIGNSSSAAAVLCCLLGVPPSSVVGRGTGLDDAGLNRKIDVIDRALKARSAIVSDPIDVLSKVGGFEIGEMAGCFIAGAARRTPMVVDGFISTAAAALASRMCPAVRDYLFFSHRSAEGGHALVLQKLGVDPILDFHMRLGEGTGAALAMQILDSAVGIFQEMATFQSAGVDDVGRG